MSKTILITGSSRGIGRAAALALAAPDVKLAVHYHENQQAAEQVVSLARQKGADAKAFCADVSDARQVSEMVADIETVFGGVDLLICNAGIAQQKLFCDLTDEDWNRMIGTHLSGTFYCCRAVLPAMIRRHSGKIITVSSMWGQTGGSCEVHYSAAKAGIIGLTKALAKEVGPSNITVNCVAPGVIATDMCAGFDDQTMAELAEETPLCRIGTAEDVADAIAFLASERANFMTGQVLSPNGGILI